MTCRQFNIRVYGLLFNDKQEVLLTDEYRSGKAMTKFPGGGLEEGEGMVDCLKREFMEELDIRLTHWEHLYTTDFYQKSYFDGSQIISVYYKVQSDQVGEIDISDKPMDFSIKNQIFRWSRIEAIAESDLTFPIDKYLLALLQDQ